MNVLEIITGIIIALGGASLIPKAIEGYKAVKNGQAQREKAENRNALGRMVEAEERADNEASFRYALQEYAARLRLMLVQMGMPEDKLPPWPIRKTQKVRQ